MTPIPEICITLHKNHLKYWSSGSSHLRVLLAQVKQGPVQSHHPPSLASHCHAGDKTGLLAERHFHYKSTWDSFVTYTFQTNQTFIRDSKTRLRCHKAEWGLILILSGLGLVPTSLATQVILPFRSASKISLRKWRSCWVSGQDWAHLLSQHLLAIVANNLRDWQLNSGQLAEKNPFFRKFAFWTQFSWTGFLWNWTERVLFLNIEQNHESESCLLQICEDNG